MAKELQAQPLALGRTLDEAGDVGDDHLEGLAAVVEPHHTQVGLERREGVVRDLGLGGRDAGDERGLAHVREADERHVGHQLQLQAQPALLAVLALLGEAGCPAAVGQEPGVALAALATRGAQPAVAVVQQIGEHLAVLGLDDGADGHLHDGVVAAGTVLLLAGAVCPAVGLAVGVVTERQQRRHVAIRHEPDVAAVAAVAAVGAAPVDVRLAPERHAAGATIAALDVEATLVHEVRHRARIGAGGADTVPRHSYDGSMPTPPTTSDPSTGPPAALVASERAAAWAATMGGHRTPAGPVRQAHAGSTVHVDALTPARPGRPGGARGRVARTGRHPGIGCGAARPAGAGRPRAHLLRARPRPHPALHRVPPPRRQDAGVRVPRRPPAHPADPRTRGRPGRHGHRPGDRAQRGAHRGDRPRPRLRARPRGPRQRGRVLRLRARWVRPRRVGCRHGARTAQPVRTDPGRHPQPLVVAACAVHARGGGRLLGGPHRLRLPRLRGRRARRHRLGRATAPGGARAVRRPAQPPAARLHRRRGRGRRVPPAPSA